MMTEEEYNERERMVEKVKSFFFTENEVVSFLACFMNSGSKKNVSLNDSLATSRFYHKVLV